MLMNKACFDLNLGLGSPPTNEHLHSKESDKFLNAYFEHGHNKTVFPLLGGGNTTLI